MLTVILLVVLGGGAGLLAVWSIDPSSRPRFASRPGLRSLWANLRDSTAAAQGELHGADDADAGWAGAHAGGPLIDRSGLPIRPPAGRSEGPSAVAEPVGGDTGVLEVVRPGALDGPARRRRRGSVPPAFTAIEGSYRDVAVTPLWRKAVSLVLLLVVLVGGATGLAAATAAVLGLAAELIDGAIG